MAKLGSKQWKLAAEISFGNVFSFFAVCGDELFQLRSNVYLEKEELDALIKTEEEFIKKDKEALEVDELRNTLQHYKYDIEKKGWFAAELKCLEEWETENRSPSKADIMKKVNDVLHLRDEVFPGVKALCEEIWRSAYLLASKEKKPLTLTDEEGENQYEFRKLEVPSCLNLGDSITISEMLCSSCKSIEKKVNVLEAMIDWQKQMSEKLERCKQHIGKYASSPEMKDKIFKELCHPGGDIEENLDCLTRVTRMLSKLEVEIPRYVNSEKGKKKVTEILISPNKSIESKLSMLEEVEITEKKMMEKLQICKQKIGKYACYPYTERQIIDSLCSDKEDIEESLKKVKPVADVLQKLEVEIPSCLSLRKMIEISGILCSSDKSIEKKVNVLEAMIDWQKQKMTEKLERCKQHIGKYASSPEMKDKIFKELCHPGGNICKKQISETLSSPNKGTKDLNGARRIAARQRPGECYLQSINSEPRVIKETRRNLQEVSKEGAYSGRPKKQEGVYNGSREKQEGVCNGRREKHEGVCNGSREKHEGVCNGSREKHEGVYNGSREKHEGVCNGRREKQEGVCNGRREKQEGVCNGSREKQEGVCNGRREKHEGLYNGRREKQEDLRTSKKLIDKYWRPQNIDWFCLHRDDNKAKLDCLKPLVEVLKKLEIKALSYVNSPEGQQTISDIFCSSASLEVMEDKLLLLEEIWGNLSSYVPRKSVGDLFDHFRKNAKKSLKELRRASDCLHEVEQNNCRYVKSLSGKEEVLKILISKGKPSLKIKELQKLAKKHSWIP